MINSIVFKSIIIPTALARRFFFSFNSSYFSGEIFVSFLKHSILQQWNKIFFADLLIQILLIFWSRIIALAAAMTLSYSGIYQVYDFSIFHITRYSFRIF